MKSSLVDAARGTGRRTIVQLDLGRLGDSGPDVVRPCELQLRVW